MSKAVTKTVLMSDVRANPVALRSVNLESEKVIELKASMASPVGLMNPISVREKTDEKAGVKYYELCDGLHRYTCAKELGWTEIPVLIKDLTDDQVLEAQMVANMHTIETTPTQYTQQLRRIIQRNPLMTEAELATKLSRSTKFIQDRLSLSKIEDSGIMALIDGGKIGITNACNLAKLPVDEQSMFVEAAMAEEPAAFAAKVDARAKELRAEQRAGKANTVPSFEPRAYLRKLSELNDELKSGKAASELTKGLKTAVEGFVVAIKYVMHLDAPTVAAAKSKFEGEQKALSEKRAVRDVEAGKRKQLKVARLQMEAQNAQAEIEGKDIPHKDIDSAIKKMADELGVTVSPFVKKAKPDPVATAQ
jgi:ParB family chromosome partitioning protein